MAYNLLVIIVYFAIPLYLACTYISVLALISLSTLLIAYIYRLYLYLFHQDLYPSPPLITPIQVTAFNIPLFTLHFTQNFPFILSLYISLKSKPPSNFDNCFIPT
ncbi:hypothetical protein GQ43DRAFT_206641 [Delitschia confertaspora ATCC 74209]|uniref:Uncharacterized protein n=1 Tax=Delitschia confertaspora ATCC 74209 TaxID=1513339 RepID=A0A9P4JDV8_9PLEO|nr:hypothetical protein GQ43DRAFT_206641 [Delitschia confertaspora ATCC 74209]